MKIKIVPFLFLLISLNGFAQNDHLEPVDGYFDMYNYRYEYYGNIRSILFNGLSESPEVRYFVLPSFETEYVLQVERGRDTKNQVIVKRAKQSIWYTKDKSTIEVETWKNSLSQKDVDLIKQLYHNAIMKTQFVGHNTSGADGTRFYFSVNNLGLNTGQTWSPSGDTKMGKLTQISEKLMEEVKSTTFAGLSTSLRSQIKELTAALFL